MRTPPRDSLAQGLVWTALGSTGRRLVAFIISICLARLLSPTEFGLIGLAAVFFGFANVFLDFGLHSALVQRRDVTDEEASSVFWLNLVVALLLASLFYVTAPLIAAFYGEEQITRIVRALSCTFLLAAAGAVPAALLSRGLQFRKLAIVETVSALGSGIIGVALALLGAGVWSLVAQSLSSAFFRTTLVLATARWLPRARFHLSGVRPMLGYGANLFAFNVFNYFSRNADNVLIGKFLGTEPLGIYSRAYGYMMLPIDLVHGIAGRVMFPALSRLQGDLEAYRALYLRSLRSIALLSFPCFVGFAVAAEPLIVTMIGEHWKGVVLPLQILCLEGIKQSVGATAGWIYMSQGRTDVMFRWGVFAGTITVGAFVAGLPWGTTGVALAYVIRGYLLFLPSIWLSTRIVKLSVARYLWNLVPTAICALVMGAIVFGVSISFLSDYPAPVTLLVEMGVGIGTYVLLLHTFKLQAWHEVLELIVAWRRTKVTASAVD